MSTIWPGLLAFWACPTPGLGVFRNTGHVNNLARAVGILGIHQALVSLEIPGHVNTLARAVGILGMIYTRPWCLWKNRAM